MANCKWTSEQLAWKIRRHGVEMTHLSGGSHLGAILSVADIVATLYADVLNYDPKNPKWEGRDRFILSKGHAGAQQDLSVMVLVLLLVLHLYSRRMDARNVHSLCLVMASAMKVVYGSQLCLQIISV